MTPDEFILEIIKAYRYARRATFKDKRVRRGRSHAVSSFAEDFFAGFLVKNDNTIDTVYVDQPLTVKEVGKTVYPDIVVVRKGVIVHLIDLKLDIGWHRDGLADLCQKHHDFVCKAQGHECRLNDGLHKERKEFKLSPKATYDVVLVSSGNIDSKLMAAHEVAVKKLAPETKLFILTDKSHPNTYHASSKRILEEVQVNHDQFDKLLKRIRS